MEGDQVILKIITVLLKIVTEVENVIFVETN